MNELIELVRRTAANLMNVTFGTIEAADALEFRHEPYWILSGQMARLNPIAPAAFDGFLPTSVRKARVRKRLIQEIDALVKRNVENLRWATRKNVEDAFRRFGRTLEESLTSNIEATRGIMVLARLQLAPDGRPLGDNCLEFHGSRMHFPSQSEQPPGKEGVDNDGGKWRLLFLCHEPQRERHCISIRNWAGKAG
jgi:hypothetical protein